MMNFRNVDNVTNTINAVLLCVYLGSRVRFRVNVTVHVEKSFSKLSVYLRAPGLICTRAATASGIFSAEQTHAFAIYRLQNFSIRQIFKSTDAQEASIFRFSVSFVVYKEM